MEVLPRASDLQEETRIGFGGGRCTSSIENGISMQSLMVWIRARGRARYCPACGGRVQRFEPFGEIPRPDARCPLCGSTERERAQVLLLRRRVLPRLARRPGLRVLHFAPEAGVARVLRAVPGVRYTSADIEPQRVMRRLDLTALELEEASVDLIFISHVLEHISDDRKS